MGVASCTGLGVLANDEGVYRGGESKAIPLSLSPWEWVLAQLSDRDGVFDRRTGVNAAN
jgi:hypothetical protein